MRGSLLALVAALLAILEPAARAGIYEQLAAEPDYTRVVSFDFEKKGNQTAVVLSWRKPRGSNLGQLSIRQKHPSERRKFDEFVLGELPRASTTYYVLPGRDVLVVEVHGAGSPGGSTYHAFSVMNGLLYRVSLVDERIVSPLQFGEHYSAGSPARIKFSSQGQTVRTMITLDPEVLERRVDEYQWDGSSYRRVSSRTCKDDECPQDWL